MIACSTITTTIAFFRYFNHFFPPFYFIEYFSVQDTPPLNIKAKHSLIESDILHIQGLLFNPPLNGTDSITKWSSSTNKTENGIFYSHGSFLTEGWSNEELWELEFDARSSNWTYVGLMPVCSAEINPFTDAKTSSYAMTSWEGINFFGGMGLSSWDSIDSMSKIKDTAWHNIKITKLSATKLKIVIDNTYTGIANYNNLQNHSTLHIGSRDNPSSRNSGGIVELRNIKVKPL